MLTKVCTKCKEEKALSAFYKQTKAKHGVMEQCKDCVKEARKLFYKNNKEKVLSRNRDYVLRNSQSVKKTKQKYATDNKDHLLTYKADWKKNNASHVNVYNAGRRATTIKATPNWADKDAMFRIYEEARTNAQHVDHIIPLTSKLVCGLHCEANLQILSIDDNLTKGNRWWPDMW